MSNFVVINLSIADATAPKLDLTKPLILDEFEFDDNGTGEPLVTGKHFTSDGLVGGTKLRIKKYTTLTAVGVDFKTTSKIYKAAQIIFSQDRVPEYIYVGQARTADTSRVVSLNAIKQENNGFYTIVDVNADETEILEVASFAETNEKFFIALTSSTDVANAVGGNILAQLKALNYNNTELIYTPASNIDTDGDLIRVDAVLAGYWGTFVPGTETQKFITLNGVVAADSDTLLDRVTDTQITNILDNNGNLYLSSLVGDSFQEGVAVSGRFADITRYSQQLKYDLKVAASLVLKNAITKVPYTDGGVEQIKHALETVLQRNIAQGQLTIFQDLDANGRSAYFPYKITTVAVNDVASADRLAREYNDFQIKVRYSSAIHKVGIDGTITV